MQIVIVPILESIVRPTVTRENHGHSCVKRTLLSRVVMTTIQCKIKLNSFIIITGKYLESLHRGRSAKEKIVGSAVVVQEIKVLPSSGLGAFCTSFIVSPLNKRV